MASFEDIYGSSYVKASDVPENGVVGQIVEIGPELFQKRGERGKNKLVIRLTCFKKPLTLNVTNGRRLQKAFGDDWEQWAGRSVSVSVQEVMFEGEPVDGILLTPLAQTNGQPT